jgi:hypothetical protein
MTTQDFLRRYRWLPAAPDDRLDWLVMVGAAWVVYVLAGVVFHLEDVMAKKPKSRKRSHTKLWISYERDKAWMVLTREASCVWLDALGSLVFNAKQCRTLATWLDERADEMDGM